MKEKRREEKREITPSFKKWAGEIGTRDQAETGKERKFEEFGGGRRRGFGRWSE